MCKTQHPTELSSITFFPLQKDQDPAGPYSREELALAASLRDGLLQDYVAREQEREGKRKAEATEMAGKGSGSPSPAVLLGLGNQAHHWRGFLRVSAPAYLVRSLCASMMRRARAVRSE